MRPSDPFGWRAEDELWMVGGRPVDDDLERAGDEDAGAARSCSTMEAERSCMGSSER